MVYDLAFTLERAPVSSSNLSYFTLVFPCFILFVSSLWKELNARLYLDCWIKPRETLCQKDSNFTCSAPFAFRNEKLWTTLEENSPSSLLLYSCSSAFSVYVAISLGVRWLTIVKTHCLFLLASNSLAAVFTARTFSWLFFLSVKGKETPRRAIMESVMLNITRLLEMVLQIWWTA